MSLEKKGSRQKEKKEMKMTEINNIDLLMDQMDQIGKLTLPLCKHPDSKVVEAAAHVNKIAHKCFLALEMQKELLPPK